MTLTVSTFDDLAAALDGALVRPGDPDWDDARRAWNLAVDQQPAAVVLAASVDDVRATVGVARVLGLRVAAQATGHNASPLGGLSGTVLLRTSALRGVTIDPQARIARVEPGAWWGDVTSAAAPHGLAALAGSSPDVGVAGYVLGGGVSWLARSHGLAANNVRALEVVTADGALRRVDTDHDPDLFWALRGGGGSFGVVTAFELALVALPEIYAGVLFYPVERAEEVLLAWRALLPELPDEVTSVGRVLHFPPLPELPPHLAGQSFVVVEAACQLAPQQADELLAPLRALGPVLDTFTTCPTAGLGALHMDPPAPVPCAGDGMLLDDCGPATISSFVQAAHAAGPTLLSVELRQLGGAVRRGDPRGGVVDRLEGDYLFFAVGVTPTPASAREVRGAVTAVMHRLAPYSTGRCYLNFAENRKNPDALFGVEAHARLRRIKAAYDPHDVIRANHPIAPVTG